VLADANATQAWPGLESESEKPGLARTPSFDAAVAPLENGKRLDGRGLEDCLAAFNDNPEGFQLVVEDIRCRNGVRRPLGVLVWRIRRGEIPQPRSGNRPRQPRTGWRYVRGSHGGTHVPDPEGTDPPPRSG
jgi:hypothetical protein